MRPEKPSTFQGKICLRRNERFGIFQESNSKFLFFFNCMISLQDEMKFRIGGQKGERFLSSLSSSMSYKMLDVLVKKEKFTTLNFWYTWSIQSGLLFMCFGKLFTWKKKLSSICLEHFLQVDPKKLENEPCWGLHIPTLVHNLSFLILDFQVLFILWFWGVVKGTGRRTHGSEGRDLRLQSRSFPFVAKWLLWTSRMIWNQ